jgi:hypothetical protein
MIGSETFVVVHRLKEAGNFHNPALLGQSGKTVEPVEAST